MSTDQRWTEETADLVANAIHRGERHYDSWEACRTENRHGRVTRHVLAALADAGLLLLPGGETREEWGVRHLNLETTQWEMHERASRKEAERSFEYYAQVWGHHTRLMSRTVHTGPWREVEEAGNVQ